MTIRPLLAPAFSLVLLTFLGVVIFSLNGGENVPLAAVTIGVEHEKAMTVTIRITTASGQSIIELGHESDSPIALSLPADWSRTEVRGVALASVTADPPVLGFTRWTLPARAGVTFKSTSAIGNLTIDSGSPQPMKVRLTTVDGKTGSATHNVYLSAGSPLVLTINKP